MLVHGGVGSARYWLNLVPLLNQAGVRVITFDQRDTGRTTNSDEPYTTADLAEDCLELATSLGLDTFSVLGFSFGGLVAQQVAIRYPSRIDRLILAATTPSTAVIPSATSETVDALEELQTERLAVTLFSEHRRRSHPERVRSECESILAEEATRTVAQHQRRAQATHAHDTRDALHRVSARTLVVVGSDDDTLPPRISKEIAGHIRDARYVELPGLAHGLSLEDPVAFCDVVAPFIMEDKP
jgi:3-oxoadipate enol-lactonase